MTEIIGETSAKNVKPPKNGITRAKRGDLICYIAFMIWPVAQFVIFYIVVNFNSFLLAFQKIDIIAHKTVWGFENIKEVFRLVATTQMRKMIWNSIKSYLIMLVIGVPLGLLFSYYIYKKMFGAGAFRVFLFMPSILSAIVTTTLFRFFVENALPAMVNDIFHVKMKGLLENQYTRYWTVMFYNLWISFGTSVLMYSNKMSNISPEISEAAKLDGASGFKEFWYVTLPLTYPTLSVFIITGVAGIFTNQFNLFSFYGWQELPIDLQTVGFYLYLKAQGATSVAEYPPLAALGILLTIVAVPLTLGVKWLLEKYGPSED